MGLQIRYEQGAPCAEGEILLATTPFETLQAPLRIARARFYTLGHNRLKFFEPRAFFALSPLEVSGCETADQLEDALRRAWAARIKETRRAANWVDGIGAKVQLTEQGTQLLLPLTGVDGPPAQVLSPTEIQLPSSGPLAEVSPNAPEQRRHRPSPSLEHSSDLEIELYDAMSRLGKRISVAARAPIRRHPDPPSVASLARRILVLDPDRANLTAAETLLLTKGYKVDTFLDPERALGAFGSRSYEIVLTAASMPRVDGLEFASQLRGLPGVEHLPVVLMDQRFNARQQHEAAELGVGPFLTKPLSWAQLGSALVQTLEHPITRRFGRFSTHLQVETELATRKTAELTEEIGRGGFLLHTKRELFPDAIEQYRIRLPRPLKPVRVEGQVVSRLTVTGGPNVLAGIRILCFREGRESDWIQLVGQLQREAPPRQGRQTI
jgi:CheY-like chemotaxis protein